VIPLKFKLEKRKESSPLLQFIFIVMGMIAAFGISGLLIISANANFLEAIANIYQGAFGGWEAFSETLVQGTPLILTGIAAVIAFRAGVWNIGAEGQFYAGAMMAFWIGMKLDGFPGPICVVIITLFSILAGALWGFIPGWLKSRFKANEIVVTVMMNYIIHFLFSYLLINYWRDPTGSGLLQTPLLLDNARFPQLFDQGRLHIGFLMSLSMAIVALVILRKMPLGYEIRAVGENPSASKYKGINIRRIVITVMIISGAVAGLAGGIEFAGTHYRARLDMSAGYGYTGIIIALIAKLNPIGVIVVAILFGGLVNGSTLMHIFTGVPVALVFCIQGIILIFVLSAQVLANYKIRRLSSDECRLPG
jgi:simple sugar transport system permease protein